MYALPWKYFVIEPLPEGSCERRVALDGARDCQYPSVLLHFKSEDQPHRGIHPEKEKSTILRDNDWKHTIPAPHKAYAIHDIAPPMSELREHSGWNNRLGYPATKIDIAALLHNAHAIHVHENKDDGRRDSYRRQILPTVPRM